MTAIPFNKESSSGNLTSGTSEAFSQFISYSILMTSFTLTEESVPCAVLLSRPCQNTAGLMRGTESKVSEMEANCFLFSVLAGRLNTTNNK